MCGAVSKGYESWSALTGAYSDGADLRALSKLKHRLRANSPYLAATGVGLLTAVEGAPTLSITWITGSHGTQPMEWLTLS